MIWCAIGSLLLGMCLGFLAGSTYGWSKGWDDAVASLRKQGGMEEDR